MTTADYARGYRDGVAAASDQIAKFFQALKDEHTTSISQMEAAHMMMEAIVLARLSPLQEEVRRLKP